MQLHLKYIDLCSVHLKMHDTHQFWITESIPNSHALKVDLHLCSGIIFVDVVGNCRDIFPCI